jgi:hypothetical protein
MSVEAARRIKRGRPDLHLTVLVVDRLADFWRNISEVDFKEGIKMRVVTRTSLGHDRQ